MLQNQWSASVLSGPRGGDTGLPSETTHSLLRVCSKRGRCPFASPPPVQRKEFVKESKRKTRCQSYECAAERKESIGATVLTLYDVKVSIPVFGGRMPLLFGRAERKVPHVSAPERDDSGLFLIF